MESGHMPERLENLNEIIDKAADRLPSSRKPSVEREDFSRKLLDIFPYFVVVCLVLWVFIVFAQGVFTFSRLIEVLCLLFVTGFAIIGVPCTYYSEKGVFSLWAVLAFTTLLTCILWISGRMMGQVYYADAIIGVLTYLNVSVSPMMQFVLGFLGTLCVLFFTSMGVLSVICGYMKRYIPSVLFTMQEHADKGIRGKSESFFMVPDIIDVKEVVVEPVRNSHKYDFRTASSISMYLFLLGLMISSYIFLNPLLINVIGWKTMLAIMLMLSMFTPALLLPWQIVRGLGAKVRSDAPRDYYLWKGAKNRLFSTFVALGAFMMMFILSIYMGNSIIDIIKVYVSFLLPLLVTSMIYGAFYANSFHENVRDSICDSFAEEMGKRNGKS